MSPCSAASAVSKLKPKIYSPLHIKHFQSSLSSCVGLTFTSMAVGGFHFGGVEYIALELIDFLSWQQLNPKINVAGDGSYFQKRP